MDKDTRNAIERATQRLRRLLEEDFAAQLYGDFDVDPSGGWAETAGRHLSPQRVLQRGKIVAALEHKRATGLSAADSVADFLRDAAFTTLNRFVALKMLEARELLQECVTRGEQSSGYREFCGLAPGVALLPDAAGYRLYIESLFDELSTEIKVLFDRRDPASVLWPKRATFEQVLENLNAPALARVWPEDETIGWVYQYFNSEADRHEARYDAHGKPKSPQNARELAVRNQFFTPRYVVQFLADNTLGRIWYEMRNSKTALTDRCEYLVRRPDETFAPRVKRDPRDLRVLDPACGSGHFLLYAFELLVTIYKEAHADPESPKSEETGRTLREDCPTLEALRQALPSLILAHNLYGVDIDARCAQIAQLALWMRAQRAYRDFAIRREDRLPIRKSNIVVAEPLVTDDRLTEEFVARLGDEALGRVFRELIDALKLAGDLGVLLRVENLLTRMSQSGQIDYLEPPEARIREALRRFVAEEGARLNTRKRLFADDAAHGLGLLETAEKKFDVVLMNPPFGEPTDESADKISTNYDDWNRNILCAFVARAHSLLAAGGLCGIVVDRTVNEKSTYEKFRRRYLLSDDILLHYVVDLGWGVLDANVEVAALVLGAAGSDHRFLGFDLREIADKEVVLRNASNPIPMRVREARRLPNAVIGYFFPAFAIELFGTLPSVREAGFDLFEGNTLKSDRYFRVVWESADQGRGYWTPLFNGTAYSRFAYPHHDVVAMSQASGAEADRGTVIRNAAKHKKSGVCFGKRGEYVDAQMLPAGFISTVEGKACLAPSEEDAWALLALINSTLFQFLINLYTGQHKYSGYVELIPYAELSKLMRAAEEARAIVDIKWKLWQHVELSPNFVGLTGISPEALREELMLATSAIEKTEARLNEAVAAAYGLVGNAEAKALLFSTASSIPPAADPFCSPNLAHCAGRCVQSAIGRVFRRFPSFRIEADAEDTPAVGVLVDDLGSPWDVANLVEAELIGTTATVLSALEVAELRAYLRASAFHFHVTYYSRSGRAAPIYWQLATPSGSYSVWLYLHALTKDIFFRVQHDYVAPKLAHEERRLDTLHHEFGENPSAAQRKGITTQESFVAELRVFLEEVQRVAPLWNPNLDDGVVINFAPLWRLVPHCKFWQKELKATWDALCAGEYDWAHMAMHLWPERVVPKCAKDRSLAIAHGLEEVFWVENDEDKWAARPIPTRSIEELVRERTSAAVRAALDSLLQAPVAENGRGRSRNRRARAAGDA